MCVCVSLSAAKIYYQLDCFSQRTTIPARRKCTHTHMETLKFHVCTLNIVGLGTHTFHFRYTYLQCSIHRTHTLLFLLLYRICILFSALRYHIYTKPKVWVCVCEFAHAEEHFRERKREVIYCFRSYNIEYTRHVSCVEHKYYVAIEFT